MYPDKQKRWFSVSAQPPPPQLSSFWKRAARWHTGWNPVDFRNTRATNKLERHLTEGFLPIFPPTWSPDVLLESAPLLFSASCGDGDSLQETRFDIVERDVWGGSANLWASCVSLINFFSSSILSAVSLRTITSSMVSTTSPFSPRFLLRPTDTLSLSSLMRAAESQIRRNEFISLVRQQNKPLRFILTLVPLWSPGVLNIWKHSAVKVRADWRVKLTLCDTDHTVFVCCSTAGCEQGRTFWENQSGGRPDSAKGLMALLTETLVTPDQMRKAQHQWRI